MDPNLRLRVATRIHFALRRHFGEDVEVSTLLQGEADAREVLWVFEASGDPELIDLARQFNATAAAPRAVRPHVVPPVETPKVQDSAFADPAPQDTAWSRNTSGFGLLPLTTDATDSDSGALAGPKVAPDALQTMGWMHRGTIRPVR